MRCPAVRVLLTLLLAAALLTGAGVASDGASVHGVDGGAVDDTPPDASAHTTDVSSLETPARDGGPDRAQVAAFDRPPETEMRVDLRPDRDAHWEVVVRYEFTDANETAVFETVSDRFLDGEIGPSETLFENFADGASRNVDREMRIETVDRSVDVNNDTDAFDVDDEVVAVGELRLTFVWTEFLEEDGEDLVLGDALTTPTNDTWLRSLSDGQSIVVMTPSGYSVSGTPGARFDIRDNAVVIEGPRAFEEDERVAVVYSPTATPQTPPWEMLAGAIVVAALLIALGLLAYRRVGPDDAGSNGAPVPGSGSDDSAVPHTAGAEDGVSAAGAESDEQSEEDLSLLSDEERVERLLELNDGRMRQADIVAETGWSDAKVSQLLSRMDDEERVEKLRLGRENLISIPEGDGDDGEGSSDGANGGSNGSSTATDASDSAPPPTGASDGGSPPDDGGDDEDGTGSRFGSH